MTQITSAVPPFAKYQQKTDRELPVIRLVPRSSADEHEPITGITRLRAQSPPDPAPPGSRA